MNGYLSFKYKKPGSVIIVLSIIMLLVSLILWKFYDNDFYRTLKVCGRLFLALGLFLFAMSLEKEEDEIIDKIRLESFFLSIAIVTAVVILNESLYFFTNQYEIDAIEMLIFLLAVKSVLFYWKLKRIS
jgi:hypothetical protein